MSKTEHKVEMYNRIRLLDILSEMEEKVVLYQHKILI